MYTYSFKVFSKTLHIVSWACLESIAGVLGSSMAEIRQQVSCSSSRSFLLDTTMTATGSSLTCGPDASEEIVQERLSSSVGRRAALMRVAHVQHGCCGARHRCGSRSGARMFAVPLEVIEMLWRRSDSLRPVAVVVLRMRYRT